MQEQTILVHYRKWGAPTESLCGEEGYKFGYPLQADPSWETSKRYIRCTKCVELDLEAKVEGSTYELRVRT